jgi:hypothetical protein
MKLISLASGGLTLLLATVACDGGEPVETRQDPQNIVREALAAMESLRSYRLEMVFAGAEEQPVVIEFEAPDDYHFLLYAMRATEGVEELEGVYEAIITGDKAYNRQCKDIDQECESWQQRPRPPVAIAGPAPTFLPDWPLVALEMAQDLQIIGTEEIDGLATTHLRGTVNHIRAVLENERRVFTAAGITSFGKECEHPVGGEEVCRELTFEENLAQQEPTLSFYDENPSTIDAWVSEDGPVRRIALRVPPHEAGDEETAAAFEYSRFNDVEIEPPE